LKLLIFPACSALVEIICEVELEPEVKLSQPNRNRN